MSGDEVDYQLLLAEIAVEFPRFRLIRKHDAGLQRAIHLGLVLVTLGAQRHYLTEYVTTIGQRVYVPGAWDQRSAASRICTLRHERVHLRQFARHGLLPMAFLYLLVPLPLGLSYFRMRYEREAYEESIRATWELFGAQAVREPAYRRQMVEAFTGGAYGWMWPFRRAVERWYDGVVASLGGAA